MSPQSLTDATFNGRAPDYRGKVRDLFEDGDRFVVVATDRISAYDRNLEPGIPQKGCALTAISEWWFDSLERKLGARCPTHRISTEARDLPDTLRGAERLWGARFAVVEKLAMLPVEFVVRGYLAGSGWKDYQKTGSVCGIDLPTGLVNGSKLEQPIFTPATKATSGHDENIDFDTAAEHAGRDVMNTLSKRSIEIYEFARDVAATKGIVLADTKFEFGQRADGTLVLADEILTPDSSRYWPAEDHRPGQSQPSFDKQYVRDYLASVGFTGDGEVPRLPDEVVQGTAERYAKIRELLTGVTAD